MIDRIKEVEPFVSALVDQRFDDALLEAREVDQLIGSCSDGLEQLFAEKPFLGLPFTVKDCVGVTGMF